MINKGWGSWSVFDTWIDVPIETRELVEVLQLKWNVWQAWKAWQWRSSAEQVGEVSVDRGIDGETSVVGVVTALSVGIVVEDCGAVADVSLLDGSVAHNEWVTFDIRVVVSMSLNL